MKKLRQPKKKDNTDKKTTDKEQIRRILIITEVSSKNPRIASYQAKRVFRISFEKSNNKRLLFYNIGIANN